VLAASLSAQQPAFDVASVKPSTAPANGWRFPPSGFSANEDLYWIIAAALEVEPRLTAIKIVSPPDQLKRILATRFEIEAKGEGNQRAMLRTLLAERFGLRTHSEIRQTPMYH
jgi:uncharacterized protein (TIGR03435 family)